MQDECSDDERLNRMTQQTGIEIERAEVWTITLVFADKSNAGSKSSFFTSFSFSSLKNEARQWSNLQRRSDTCKPCCLGQLAHTSTNSRIRTGNKYQLTLSRLGPDGKNFPSIFVSFGI